MTRYFSSADETSLLIYQRHNLSCSSKRKTWDRVDIIANILFNLYSFFPLKPKLDLIRKDLCSIFPGFQTNLLQICFVILKSSQNTTLH